MGVATHTPPSEGHVAYLSLARTCLVAATATMSSGGSSGLYGTMAPSPGLSVRDSFSILQCASPWFVLRVHHGTDCSLGDRLSPRIRPQTHASEPREGAHLARTWSVMQLWFMFMVGECHMVVSAP